MTEFGKLRGVGSNEDPNRCLEKREARSFDGGVAVAGAAHTAAVPTKAAEEGSQLSKFRKLSLALCSEQRRARRGTQRVGGALA